MQNLLSIPDVPAPAFRYRGNSWYLTDLGRAQHKAQSVLLEYIHLECIFFIIIIKEKYYFLY